MTAEVHDKELNRNPVTANGREAQEAKTAVLGSNSAVKSSLESNGHDQRDMLMLAMAFL